MSHTRAFPVLSDLLDASLCPRLLAHYFQELLTREPFLPILITRKGNPGPSGVNFGEESLPEPGLYLYLLIL